MRIAITGGTGFVGSNVAEELLKDGHEVVLISRKIPKIKKALNRINQASFLPIALGDKNLLTKAFDGCEAVIHCAGINREIGSQTYANVHIHGTRNVIDAAKASNVKKILFISFLKARPNSGSAYHESKWLSEEMIRKSGLDYTILKPGVIYGRGDHMLDHLSQAFLSLPVFAFVGFRDRNIRPVAIEDLTKIIKSVVIEKKLSFKTVPVLGPEELSLCTAVRRVAHVLGKNPFFIRLPVSIHYLIAWLLERIMVTPLVSLAQIRILSEGLSHPMPNEHTLPEELIPKIPFTEEQIKTGLPESNRLSIRDFRLCSMCLKG